MPKAGHSKDWKNDPDFRTFVQWSCLNAFEREEAGDPPWCLEYQYEVAEHLGVDPDTLRRWKKRPEFQGLRQELADQWLADSRPQRIRAAIYSAQIPGKEGYNDRRDLFYIDGTRDDTKKTEISIEHQLEVMYEARSMTKEELQAKIIEGLRSMPELEGKSDEELRQLSQALRRLAPGRPQAAQEADEKFGFDPDDWRESDDEIELAPWHYTDEAPAPDPGDESGAPKANPEAAPGAEALRHGGKSKS